MSTATVTLTKKQWQSFCKTLQGLARQCNDVDINQGIIRQRSNGSAAIFEVDLRPVVGELTLTITNLKEKVKTLKAFTGGVTLEPGQNEVVVSDGVSSYSILNPDRNYLDNKFMSQQEMGSMVLSVLQEPSLLIRNRIEKKMIKRIRTALSKLHRDTYRVVFAKHSASFVVARETGGSNQSSEVITTIIRDIPLFEPTIGYATLPPMPFESFDCDGDMVWELYRVDKRLFSKISGRIGEVNAAVFTTGELKNDPPGPQKQAKSIRG
jgi:hypothetical protein